MRGVEYKTHVGDRQRGRISSDSVIHCGTSAEEISDAIDKAMQADFRQIIKYERNPYEGENTSVEIVSIIKRFLRDGMDIKKRFYDLHIGQRV